MKLKEALEILKNTGYNINLFEAQFTDRVMQDAMEDDMFIGADEMDDTEAVLNDANAYNEYVEQVKSVLSQVEAVRKAALELVESPFFKEIEPQEAASICHICTDSDDSCDQMYEEYYGA